jgi:hypothetical protein
MLKINNNFSKKYRTLNNKKILNDHNLYKIVIYYSGII